jgi:hypothetical protein
MTYFDRENSHIYVCRQAATLPRSEYAVQPNYQFRKGGYPSRSISVPSRSALPRNSASQGRSVSYRKDSLHFSKSQIYAYTFEPFLYLLHCTLASGTPSKKSGFLCQLLDRRQGYEENGELLHLAHLIF